MLSVNPDSGQKEGGRTLTVESKSPRGPGQHDPDAPPGSPRALSHRASEVVCSRRMILRPIRGPTARFARAPIMLPGSALRAGEMFPVTRELQLVSMSVGPRYSRAVLVK